MATNRERELERIRKLDEMNVKIDKILELLTNIPKKAIKKKGKEEHRRRNEKKYSEEENIIREEQRNKEEQ